MRIHFPAGMASYAHVSVRMARLAGLQVPARFSGVFRSEDIILRVARHEVRFDLHAARLLYLTVAVLAEA